MAEKANCEMCGIPTVDYAEWLRWEETLCDKCNEKYEAWPAHLSRLRDYSGSSGLAEIQDELLNQENPDLEELERITEMIRNPPFAAKMDSALWHLLQIAEYRDI